MNDNRKYLQQNMGVPRMPGMPNDDTQPMIDRVFTGANTGLSTEGTLAALRNIVNDLSNTEAQTANPNLGASPLYGYGNPALSYRGEEFPWMADADERDMPANQDTLDWHFYNTPVFGDTVDFHNQATPEQKEQLAREFTLLRNANDYQRQQNLNALADQYKQESLYGSALQDILEQSDRGRSILNSLPPELLIRARERNITGPANPGSAQIR